jgi:hypothetical protein
MTAPAPREITPNELAALPFGFLDPHWVHQDPPYSDYIKATWNSFSVWSNLPTGPWHWDADDKELTDSDWESFYPGYYLIKDLQVQLCTATASQVPWTNGSPPCKLKCRSLHAARLSSTHDS